MKQNVDSWKYWGRRLRVHLKENGENLAKLAERMVDDDGKQMAESSLRSWTNGTRKVNLEDFFELCTQAKADPVQILFGRPLMGDQLKSQIGALASSIFGADPAADPDYGKFVASVGRSNKQRNRAAETADTAGGKKSKK